MARRKIKGSGIVLAIALVILIAGIVGACAYLFKVQDTFGVKINDTLYVKNAEGIVFDNTTTLIVENPFSDGYDVKIYPQAVKDDFVFTIGEEEYKWSDTLSTEFTDGFVITEKETECVIFYTNLATVIAKALRYDYGDVLVADVADGDLFALCLTSGDHVIKIGFTLADLSGNVGITEITLDTGGLIFGG